MRGAVSFALLIALAVGCESPIAAPVPRGAEKPRLYHPIAVGTKWEYRQRNGNAPYRKEVTSVEQREGDYLVTLAYTDIVPKPGDVPTLEQYAVSERGVFFLGTDLESPETRIVFDEPFCVLKLPYKRGEKWGGRDEEPHVTGDIETITVPAGEFECIRVDWQGVPYWYAPGVGLVRNGDDHNALELISFSVPKS